MKNLYLLLLIIVLNCVQYVDIAPFTVSELHESMQILTEIGYTDIHVLGECQHSTFLYSAAFVAVKNDTVISGCLEYNDSTDIQINRSENENCKMCQMR